MTDEMMTCAPHPTTAALEARVGEALRKSYMFAGGHDIEGEYCKLYFRNAKDRNDFIDLHIELCRASRESST